MEDARVSDGSDSVQVVSVDEARFSSVTEPVLLFKDEGVIGGGVLSKAKFDKSKVCQTVHDSI